MLRANSGAREAIQQAGGIAGQTELAQHLHISRQRLSQLAQIPTFPQSVGMVSGSPAWLVGEVVAWKKDRKPGRPRKIGHQA